MWQNRVANKATAEFTQVKMCSSHRRQAISFGSLSYTNRTRKGTLLLISPHWSVGLWFNQTNKQSIPSSGVPRGGQGREGVVGISVVLVDELRRLRELLFSCNTYCTTHTVILKSITPLPKILRYPGAMLFYNSLQDKYTACFCHHSFQAYLYP